MRTSDFLFAFSFEMDGHIETHGELLRHIIHRGLTSPSSRSWWSFFLAGFKKDEPSIRSLVPIAPSTDKKIPGRGTYIGDWLMSATETTPRDHYGRFQSHGEGFHYDIATEKSLPNTSWET